MYYLLPYNIITKLYKLLKSKYIGIKIIPKTFLSVEIEHNLNIPSSRPGFFNSFDQILGSGLDGLSGRLDGLSSLDPFSVFGSSRRSWWRGENVCVERDVIEEGDEKELNNNNNNQGFGVFQMNMQVSLLYR